MNPILALHVALGLLLASQQVVGDEGDSHHRGHTIEKRHVGMLAMTGDLPYRPGKRYVAALARNGDLIPFMRPGWNKKLHHSLEDLEERLEDSQEDQYTKRYIGALAKSGDLRTRDRDEKRDDVDSLLHELITSEELRRLRLEALREELFREREERAEFEEEPEEDKRSVASLARSGNLPMSLDGKRASRLGRSNQDYPDGMDDEFERRNAFSNEELMDSDSAEKRGGISSLARNGYTFPNKRHSVDDDLEELMNEVYGIDDKRNVASLARGFNFPSNEKKNIGSFFRSGGLSGMPHVSKKDSSDEWDDTEEDKRNLPSLLRDRTSPLGEGKRHIGSLFKSGNMPFAGPYAEKKNIGSLARNRDFPYAYRSGAKREAWGDEETDEMSKRYVATLLRQGRLPVGLDSAQPPRLDADDDDTALKDDNHASSSEEDRKDDNGDDKNMSMRKKKSVTAVEEQAAEKEAAEATAASTPTQVRTKRETFVPLPASSGDYIVPMMQPNAAFAEFDGSEKYSDDYSSPINKRYYAVRGGKIPGGRLPHIGRRSRPANTGRRQKHMY